jgi:hypothetical protein
MNFCLKQPMFTLLVIVESITWICIRFKDGPLTSDLPELFTLRLLVSIPLNINHHASGHPSAQVFQWFLFFLQTCLNH